MGHRSKHSPAAGTGAGGIDYSQGSGYDTGTAVKGYMANKQRLNTGEGYMSTPAGATPGFGIENEGSAHNTGIGATGAGTGTSGYHHGKGNPNAIQHLSEEVSSTKDAHKLRDKLHLHHHGDQSKPQ